MNEKDDVQILCQNIKLLRQKHNLSKTQMSQILGVSIKTLNRLEDGFLPPRISCELIFRIQRQFGIQPRQLFDILN